MKDVEHQSTPIQSKKPDDTYEMFKVIQAMIEKQSVKSVSYTHLDVYKRQDYGGGISNREVP